MMKGTLDLLGKIFTNILTAFYEPFGCSLLLSFPALFFYLYAYEPIEAGKDWRSAIVTWNKGFKESVFFQKVVFGGFCDFTYPVQNPVKSETVDEPKQWCLSPLKKYKLLRYR